MNKNSLLIKFKTSFKTANRKKILCFSYNRTTIATIQNYFPAYDVAIAKTEDDLLLKQFDIGILDREFVTAGLLNFYYELAKENGYPTAAIYRIKAYNLIFEALRQIKMDQKNRYGIVIDQVRDRIKEWKGEKRWKMKIWIITKKRIKSYLKS